jgi:hypothetical protein
MTSSPGSQDHQDHRIIIIINRKEEELQQILKSCRSKSGVSTVHTWIDMANIMGLLLDYSQGIDKGAREKSR